MATIQVVLMEDDVETMELLSRSLSSISADIQVVARLSTVRESIAFIQAHGAIDLIISDVQLRDGLSFEVFRATGCEIPVIFITGYDAYVLEAFKNNSIEYLLKPVDLKGLEKAVVKYRMLQQHFTQRRASMQKLHTFVQRQARQRLVARRGNEQVLLRLADTVLFQTQHKVVQAVDRQGRRYLVDRNLGELQELVEPGMFFRANRQYLVNINYIKSFKAYDRVKLVISLSVPEGHELIIVSQEAAAAFRKWIAGT